MERKLLGQRTREFSKKIIDLCKQIDEQKQYVISRQLMKSATAIGAMAHEAQHAETTDDFIHKMKIASKEANETDYWLCLCRHITEVDKQLEVDLEIISKIIGKSISTAKNTRQKKAKKKGDRRT
jgi:four helix bundle protein